MRKRLLFLSLVTLFCFPWGGYFSVAAQNTCETITSFPWTENFNGLTVENSIPACWNNTESDPSDMYASRRWCYVISVGGNGATNGTSHDGSKCVRFDSYANQNGQYNLLKTPTLHLPASPSMYLTFWYKNPAGGDLSVYISTDGGTTLESTPLVTGLIGATEWTLSAPISLSSYANQNVVIVFKGTSNSGNNDAYIYLDDVTVLSCPAPHSLTSSLITATTATISWAGSTGSCVLQYSTDANFETGTSTVENINGMTYSVSGLSPVTTYYVRVKSVCGETNESAWSDVTSFTTPCNAVTSFPWTENFNNLTVNHSIPACWNNTEGSITWTSQYNWAYCTNTSMDGYGSTQGTSHDGSNCVRFDSRNASENSYNYLKTLPLSLPSTPAMKLTFAYKNPTGGDFSVYISTDGGTTHETALVTGLTGVSNWTQRIIDLSSYAGQEVTIVFKGTSNSHGQDAYIYLDDVTVGPCVVPSALTATDITTAGATLGWTENGSATSWVLQYSTNINFGTNTEVEVSTTPTQAITGLSPNTLYYARVKAVCGDNNESGWGIVARFVTPCEAVTSFPWTENFNSLNVNYSIPDCWNNDEGNTSEAALKWCYDSYHSSFDGSKCMTFNSHNSMEGIFNYLKTPKLSLPSSPAMELSFWYKNPAGGDFSVYISTDGGTTHETALVTGLTGVSNWAQQIIDLSAYAGQNNVVIVFKGTSNYGGNEAYLYMDDIKVTSCLAPTAPVASNITSTTATIGWSGSATNWVLQYSTDANFGTNTEVSVSTTPSRTISGLSPEATYYVRVKSVCGENDHSAWSSVMSFSTLASCPVPTDLTVSNITTTEATLSWTGIANSWQICINGDEENLITASSNPYTLSGLTPFTDYTVKVRANCDGNEQSDWSGEENFTTLATCPAPTALSVSNIAATEVSLSWTETGSATSWQYSLNDGAPVTVTSTPYTLSGLTPATDYTVKVRAYCSANDQSVWSSVVEFTTPVSCPAPTSLAVSNITTTGATLSWTETGNANSWQYSLNDGDPVTVTSNPYTLSGLTHSTAYTVKVRAYCNENDQSEWSSVETFRTACGIVTSFPWREDFNSLTENNSIPACWDNTESSARRWGYSASASSAGHNGTKCVYFNSGIINDDNYNYNYLRTPSLSLPALPMQLTFWYNNYNYGTITVYISTDGGTNMTELNTFYANLSGWTKETIDLSTYAGQEVVIFFKGTSSCNPCYDNIYLDDVAVTALCSQPTALAVTAVTATTATISWTGSGSSWQVSINNGDPITVDENPYTCTGLTASTAYTVKVRTYCDEIDQSEWSSVSFTTPCEAITSFPWTEDFNSLTENNSIPECWNNDEGTTGNNSYKWCFNTETSGDGATNGTSHDGSNCVRFDSYWNNTNNTNFLKTKPISLPAEPMQLTFWYKNPAGGDFSVYISTDGGATHETALITGLTGVSTWIQCNPISLSSYANREVVIVFKGTSNYGNSNAIIYLDDVTVSLPPTCPSPNGLSVSSITSTTADLSWTETGTATAWQICLNGDEEHPIAANSNPFTVTGLNAYTDYTVKVRSYCAANDQSEWSSVEAFRTTCGIVTTFPWTENFNSLTENNSIPACWNNSEGTTDYSNRRWCYNTGAPGASNSNGHNSSKCVRFDSYYNGNGNTNFLKTPTFRLPANTAPQLTFWYLFSNGGDFSVYISSDGGEMTPLVSSLPSGVDSWTQQTVDLSSYVGHEVVIAFKGTSDCSSYPNAFIYLDDVTVKASTKDITANKWYAISTPMHDDGESYESISNVDGLTDPNYDLFRYNETTGTWENQKSGSGAAGFNTLTPGRGYIYRRNSAETLTYGGVPNSAESYSVTLTATNAAGDLKGFNLVGNPYPFRVKLDRSYYSLNTDGSWTAHLYPHNDSLEVGQGALVYTETNNETLTFYASTRSTNAGTKSLPPLPKGLCLGGDSDDANGDVRAPRFAHFAHISDGQLVVTGEGTLQAYDMMGRMLFSQEISIFNSQFSISLFPAAGVYILRLNGQSQKIVINK